VGVEHAEVPQTEPTAQPPTPEVELSEMAKEIDARESYLAAERDSTHPVATAVLRDATQNKQMPAVGMAVIEVTAGGFGVRIAAQLEQGTHHVYVLDEVMDCSGVDLAKKDLVGSPDPERSEYLGALVNVRSGAARFQRLLPEGVSSYRSLLGHPLLLVHARGDGAVCGVFLEAGEEPFEEAVSSR
jgi:hypothetical protein